MAAPAEVRLYVVIMITTLDMADYAGSLIAKARKIGFEYEMYTDYGEVNAVCREMGKPYNTRLLDPLFQDFTVDNCFWFLVRHHGDVIACIGVRKDILEKKEIFDFLDRQYARVYFSRSGSAIDPSWSPPVFDEIGGVIIYLGDLYVKEEYRSGNSGFSLSNMVLLAQALAFSKWRFDWLYAFIRDKHVEHGYAALYKAAYQYPSAVRWLEKTELRADEDWLVCSRAIDFEHQVKVELSKIRRSP